MFRNQYDSDVTVWSPQGRLHQVEYAMEAAKLGAATVGLKNETHAVLVARKRACSPLSAHQIKIIPIDAHCATSLSGLIADARLLSRYLRNECMNFVYSYGKNIPIVRLMSLLASKLQSSTQRYDRRPYGVSLLVAGYDNEGPHIFHACPSANIYDCKAMAIGARSQSARTYLEKHLNEFAGCSLTELIKQGLRALRDTLPNDTELTNKNVAIGYVGKDTPWIELDEEATQKYLSMIEGEERRLVTDPSGQSSQETPEGGTADLGEAMETAPADTDP